MRRCSCADRGALGSSIRAAASELNATISANVGTVSEPLTESLTPSVDPLEVTRSQILAEVITLTRLQASMDAAMAATRAAVGSADASFGELTSAVLPAWQVGNVPCIDLECSLK